MATWLTLSEVLEKAIKKEIEAQQLYGDLSREVNEEAAKDAFQELASQEQGHQKLLEQYLNGKLKEGALGRGQVIDYKIAEQLDLPEKSPDLELKDIFLLAANREKASHEFYLSLAGIHPPGEVKSLLDDLALQELKHKHRVEFLYTEVAFPQTSGG